MTHDDEHERWLEQWTAAGVDAEDPQVRTRIAECPECADRWSEVRAVTVALEGAGAAMREDLRAAHAERDAPGEDRITASTLDPLRRRPRRPSRMQVVAGALAIAAGLVVWVWTRGPDPPAPTPTYLGESLVLRGPAGPGADFSLFRWDGVLPPGGWFVVVVFDTHGRELLRSPRLEERAFRPPAGVELPDAIEWRVESHDSAGPRESATARASRR